MTDVLTLDHLEEMREALDSAAVPLGGRIVMMHEDHFHDWCEALSLSEDLFRVNRLGNGMLEVYV
jgi:hypothetical protein